MLSPMQLENCWLEELVVQLNPSQTDNSATEHAYRFKTLEFDAKASLKEVKMRLAIEIEAGTNPKRSAYRRIRVIVRGFFSLASEDDNEFLINELSILYGVARGMICNVTGSTPAGMFVLPSINFSELFRRKGKQLLDPDNLPPLPEFTVPAAILPDLSRSRPRWR